MTGLVFKFQHMIYEEQRVLSEQKKDTIMK